MSCHTGTLAQFKAYEELFKNDDYYIIVDRINRVNGELNEATMDDWLRPMKHPTEDDLFCWIYGQFKDDNLPDVTEADLIDQGFVL